MVDHEYPPTTIPAIISILMLLAGIPSFLPYGYYTLLRLVVCGTGAYISLVSFSDDKRVLGVFSALIALLFNPIIPVHLDKEIWVVIDIVTAIFFGASVFLLKSKAQG